MALRLLFEDTQHRDVGVFLISAYAPVGKVLENEWEECFGKLTTCLQSKQNNDIIVIGTDCNSSMSCKSGREIDSPLGCFGLNHTNESRLRFLTYLAINNHFLFCDLYSFAVKPIPAITKAYVCLSTCLLNML